MENPNKTFLRKLLTLAKLPIEKIKKRLGPWPLALPIQLPCITGPRRRRLRGLAPRRPKALCSQAPTRHRAPASRRPCATSLHTATPVRRRVPTPLDPCAACFVHHWGPAPPDVPRHEPQLVPGAPPSCIAAAPRRHCSPVTLPPFCLGACTRSARSCVAAQSRAEQPRSHRSVAACRCERGGARGEEIGGALPARGGEIGEVRELRMRYKKELGTR